MLNIRPNLFETGFPAHYPLIFTTGCGIDQIFLLYENTFILLAKENSSGLLKAFQYCEKFLLSGIAFTLWISQSSDMKEIFCC